MGMTFQNKKSSIILVLKVLEKYSDEEHHLTYQAIIDKVKELYSVELERKSVAYSIELLEELGYDINRSHDRRDRGVALYARQFDLSEARFLIEAVHSSKAISAKQAKDLVDKIQQGFSKYMRRPYGAVGKIGGQSKAEQRDTFASLSVIDEAIAKRKCVTFQMKGYNDSGEPCLRHGGVYYTVSPYYIVNNHGRYYLLGCSSYGEPKMRDFRLDYMVGTTMDSQSNYIDPETVLEEGFDIDRYLEEHIYLLHGEIVDALIRIEEHIEGRKGSQVEAGIRYLRDWYGNRARIYKDPNDGKLYARVRCDASSLFYWIMQYSEEFTLIEPKERVEEIKIYLMKYLEKYQRNGDIKHE